jgi:hypothetical protein
MTLSPEYVAWRLAYARACRFDRMPVDTVFAIFSAGNPHLAEMTEAFDRWLEIPSPPQSPTPGE